ncbi:importin-alpha export receptor, partial [Ascoidea rubescens DSM 1968]
MADVQTIVSLLNLSLNPATANQSERSLKSLETSIPSFAIILLEIVENAALGLNTRLAASLFFKNFIKRKWIDENGNYKLDVNQVQLIKSKIVGLMINLTSFKNLQLQIADSISIIADSDFPQNWTNLIDDLVSNLVNNGNDPNIVNGVLIVAHSIFKKWRPLFRSDDLFLEIKLVIEKFSQPFLELFVNTDRLIDLTPDSNILLQNLLLIVKVYYDFNCQDIPEFFEDNINVGMNLLLKYLKLEISADNYNNEETLLKIKSSIVDLIQLYVSRYQDVFKKSRIQAFTEIVYSLLTTKLTLDEKFDLLTSKCLSFLTSVIKISSLYNKVFSTDQALNEILFQIILPNITLREYDEELFEDDPIEYIRRDLEGSDSDTRRRSSIDFLRELKDKDETKITEIVLKFINQFLLQYSQDPINNWKQKDTANNLFISLAAKGSITNVGITSTNLLVDIVQFFSDNIASDLTSTNCHPILKVDAVKYIYLFRNQLTKQQFIEIFPILTKLLLDENYIVYSYTAITIEKILSLRTSSINNNINNNIASGAGNNGNDEPIFSKNDIKPIGEELINNLFTLILKNYFTPEKLAENEYLMKCLMRVLLVCEDNFSNNEEYVNMILNQLISIIEIIGTNPSNPKFTHYSFEAIAAVILRNCGQYKEKIGKFMDLIIPKFLTLLGREVFEFIPYVFQILCQLLELYSDDGSYDKELPNYYRNLIKPILSPSIWEYRGNIPAISRLIVDIIEVDGNVFDDNLVGLLGVFQKLISSVVNDKYGFDILESILLHIKLNRLQPYIEEIARILLTRLQNGKTEQYVKRFVLFLATLINVLGGKFVIKFIDQIQDGLFGNIYEAFIFKSLVNITNNLKERKIILVGIIKLICKNAEFIEGKYNKFFIKTLDKLIDIGYKSEFNKLGENNENRMSNEIDISEYVFGSSFSKLVIVGNKRVDPVPEINNTNGAVFFIIKTLKRLDDNS